MNYIIPKSPKNRVGIIIVVIIFLLMPIILLAQPTPMSKEDLVLGEISISDSMEKVIKTHGKPLNIKRHDQNTLEYSYKNIIFYFNKNNNVNYINSSSSNASNPIITPRGIAVGNSVEDMIKVYGNPDRKDSFRNNIVGYTYGMKITRASVLLLFECDSRTNKIVGISLYDAL